MDEAPGIGPGNHLDAGRQGLVQALFMQVHHGLGPLNHVWRADRGVKLVDFEGGHKECAFVGHHSQQVRVFGQVAPMLDGPNPSLDAHAQSRPAHGVAHCPAFQGFRFLDQGFDFVGTEFDVQRAMARPGTGAAGGGKLDDIGSHPGHLAHLGAYSVGTIGHACRCLGIKMVGVMMPRAAHPVGQAAGRGNDSHGKDQPGTVNQTFFNCLLEPVVQPAGLPDAGVTRGQGVFDGQGRSYVTH